MISDTKDNQTNLPLSSSDLKLLSNMPKYLEQICDAQNFILNQQSSVNNYLLNKDLPISNDDSQVKSVTSSLNTNILILNELKHLSLAINHDIQTLWSAFKKMDETVMKSTYNILKQTIQTYYQYVNDTKQTQIKNNGIIHTFLKKAKLQQEIHLADLQLQKAKHKKIYQNKSLIITEKKIYLPYKDEDIQKLAVDNCENKIDEIINKKYVITNVKPYKSSSSHRFTQAYKLSKVKSKKTHFQALKFALKMARIKNLHPAVIHACSNEDQLENYIMFLNQGNPSAFTDFDIKFQISPI